MICFGEVVFADSGNETSSLVLFGAAANAGGQSIGIGIGHRHAGVRRRRRVRRHMRRRVRRHARIRGTGRIYIPRVRVRRHRRHMRM